MSAQTPHTQLRCYFLGFTQKSKSLLLSPRSEGDLLIPFCRDPSDPETLDARVYQVLSEHWSPRMGPLCVDGATLAWFFEPSPARRHDVPGIRISLLEAREQLARSKNVDPHFATLLHLLPLPEGEARLRDYEINASLELRHLQGSYFNAWYPHAMDLVAEFGLEMELSAEDSPSLHIRGRSALSSEQVQAVEELLIDIGKHCRGRLMRTQVLDGQMRLDDLADPEYALSLGE